MSKLDKLGREIIDSAKIALAVKFRPLTEDQKVRNLVHGILSEQNRKAGFETFDESIDFDVEDDPFPQSAHELGAFDEQQLDNFERLVRSGHFDKEIPAPKPDAPVSGKTGAGDNAPSNNPSPPVQSGGNQVDPI